MKRREQLKKAIKEVGRMQSISGTRCEIIENCFLREVSAKECAALCRLKPADISCIYALIAMHMMQSSMDYYLQ